MTTPSERKMTVIYQGKKYAVLYPSFCGDYSLYALKSNFPDGSMFPAKKSDCRTVKSTDQR